VVVEAARIIETSFGHTICGLCDGYSDPTDVRKAIERAAPEVVMVALGNPRQELWIADFHPSASVPLLIGVGALFDFLAGNKLRAPMALRVAKLEWLYRLVLEPRRLWRRYTIDIVWFFLAVVKQKFSIETKDDQ
jgi:exopolysaccharide biosynthesis WecB/TagA/CpsF family protein